MKSLWKILAWASIACGLGAYSIGWISLFSKKMIWGVLPEFYFYDSIAAGIFGIFFLIYAIHSGNKH